MTLYYPYIYAAKCPSCGESLVLMVAADEGGSPGNAKWIRSEGIRWGREMKVGTLLGGVTFECASCLTEFSVEDFCGVAKVLRGRKHAGNKEHA